MKSTRIDQYHNTFSKVLAIQTDSIITFTPQKIGRKIRLLAGAYKGKYAIAIEGENSNLELTSTNLISVGKIITHEKTHYIFSLEDENLLPIFISFAVDLESIIDANNEVTIIELYNRYLYWQKMFKSVNGNISEKIIKGLISELYILDSYLIPKYGIEEALSGWIGPNSMHKDFAYEKGLWIEAKAINSGKNTVEISSVEQLEADTIGYLVISEFENTSLENTEGIRLIDMVQRVNTQIDMEDLRMMFYDKIVNLGIDIIVITDENYSANEYRYIIHDTRWYTINNLFPRLNREFLPTAIGKVKYDLLIPELLNFEVKFE